VREHTPPACGFRRRAENFVPHSSSRPQRPTEWGDESSGATPELARETRALPMPISEFGFSGGEPDAGKPPVQFDAGRNATAIDLDPLNPSAPPTLLRLSSSPAQKAVRATTAGSQAPLRLAFPRVQDAGAAGKSPPVSKNPMLVGLPYDLHFTPFAV